MTEQPPDDEITDEPWQPPNKADWHGKPDQGVLADDRHVSDQEAEEALSQADAPAEVPEADPDFGPERELEADA